MKKSGKQHDQILDSVELLEQILFKLGRFEEAEQVHLRALEGRECIVGGGTVEALRSMGAVSQIYMEPGRSEKAEELLVEVLEARLTQIGRIGTETVVALECLTALYTKQKKLRRLRSSVSKQ